jgi:hypothetical protein
MAVVVVLNDQTDAESNVLVTPGMKVMRGKGKLGRGPIRSSGCVMMVGKMNYLKSLFSTNGFDPTTVVLDDMHRTHLDIW